ncbi:hypothetical protein MPH_01960 [Macrophomina phaseolina MS6]|uniref:Uncharacterized protein n=1 Tax=Macrophomina phaseolina (strain MS6) TaxID=1126212 RepID=K2RDT5_MACPH|nr:hypothetical protein MPH_01960 [Macrophomina phaseolina MS6]
MANAIARSKSMTLKRSKRSTRYMDNPLPVANPQFLGTDVAASHNDLRLLQKAPPKRADSGTASASGDEMPRPRTANSAIERSRALHTTGAPIVVQHEHQTFDFPTPSPEAVYQSREKLHRDQTVPIGMAIGSPTQNNATAWKQSHPATPKPEVNASTANVDNASETDVPPSARPTTSDGKKVKISRWKSLFGRRPADKPPATPAPFYQLQQPAQPPAMPTTPARTGANEDAMSSRADLADNEKSKGGKVEEKKSKGRLRSKSSAAADARAATLPLDPPKMPNAFPELGSPKPPPKDHPSPEREPKKKPSRFGFHKQESKPQLVRAETSPILNVDIPTIEMERYSVMFGSLLKGDRQSNLLMRRQGTERLKPLNSDSLRMADRSLQEQDEQGGNEQRPKPTRRATSPATPTFQTPTIGLSLFPRDSMSGSRSNSPVPTHHRLQRSFTAPISPSRNEFDTRNNETPAPKEKPVVAKHITEEPQADADLDALRKELISPAFSVSTHDSEASFESAESSETAIQLRDNRMKSKYNGAAVDTSDWEIVTKKQPNLQLQTTMAQGNVVNSGSGSGSTLSLQSQSPLSSLSGQSFAQAKETVARQNSLRERQRQQQHRERKQEQSPTTLSQAPGTAGSPKSDQQGRKPSYASSHGSEKHQGEPARDKDAEMMLQQQQQFRERKQKQKGEQQQPQQQASGGPKRQPTLKERAEEVQNAARVAIARQVSISRQRAQQEMLRAQKASAATHNSHNVTNGIGNMTISSNQKLMKTSTEPPVPSPGGSSMSGSNPSTPQSAGQLPTLLIPEDEPKPKLARQESLRRAGRNGTPSTKIVHSPTGERLVEKRTLTPVLVDIPNRKSVVGNIVDEGDFDAPLLPPNRPFAFADPNRASTVSFSHLNC